jgi:hypothetical protein
MFKNVGHVSQETWCISFIQMKWLTQFTKIILYSEKHVKLKYTLKA